MKTKNKSDYYSDMFYPDPSSPSGIRWKVERRSGPNNTKLERSVGDVAGVVGKHGRTNYWKVQFTVDGVTHHTTSHAILWSLINGCYSKPYVVDHIDGNGLNNQLHNLRLITGAFNKRNQKMPITNTTGHTGICFQEKPYATYWVAYWREDKKSKSKCFRINPEDSESYDTQLRRAIEYRASKLKENSHEGWTERHGYPEGAEGENK